MGDVWEIGIVAPVARERTGYPTQKPEALLERLLLSLTNPGDLVIDPYLGSGTTLAVAAKLERRAIGIDLNPDSIRVASERLSALGVASCCSCLQPASPTVKKAMSPLGSNQRQRVA
jgi:DNA modification methylase